jgi:hypothetical protein
MRILTFPIDPMGSQEPGAPGARRWVHPERGLFLDRSSAQRELKCPTCLKLNLTDKLKQKRA